MSRLEKLVKKFVHVTAATHALLIVAVLACGTETRESPTAVVEVTTPTIAAPTPSPVASPTIEASVDGESDRLRYADSAVWEMLGVGPRVKNPDELSASSPKLPPEQAIKILSEFLLGKQFWRDDPAALRLEICSTGQTGTYHLEDGFMPPGTKFDWTLEMLEQRNYPNAMSLVARDQSGYNPVVRIPMLFGSPERAPGVTSDGTDNPSYLFTTSHENC